MSKDKKTQQDSQHDTKSMFQIVCSQFIEHRMAMAGFLFVVLFVLIALGAPLISSITGINPNSQNVLFRYQAPFTTVELPEDSKELRIETFIENNSDIADSLTTEIKQKFDLVSDSEEDDVLFDFILGRDTKEILGDIGSLSGQGKTEIKELVNGFSTFHLLGTDELGRDVLMRLIYAARVSLGVGILVALAASLIGLLVGTFAGYYGGWVDAVLSRFTDSMLSLPLLPLMIVFAAIDLKTLPFFELFITASNESIVKLVTILCIFSWMAVGRLVRGSVLSLKSREFILAAKTLGATDLRIMLTHVAPNVVAPLLVAATLGVGNAILFESALSFLGLGIQPPTASWGNMLFNAQELIHEAPLLAILPGVLILVTTISFNFIGDGLQDAIDPKAIKR